MPYPEELVAPMRAEVTRLGVKELRTAEEVEKALAGSQGTALVFVNSVCGCAAANARPGLALAAKHPNLPDAMYTVFAGQDTEAVNKARTFFTGYPPSSPSIGLLQEGKLVHMIQRYEIEGRDANQVAEALKAAFDQYCGVKA